jgi:MFS family permease
MKKGIGEAGEEIGTESHPSDSLLGRYIHRIRSFSLNAKLLLLSSILDGISFGIWDTIFNLYLKRGLGFEADFISQVISMSMLATGFIAIPAGLLCEGIGRKKSFLLGTVVSNLFDLAQILTANRPLLLGSSLASGLFGTISWVAYAPFMVENSQRDERTYLFGVSWALMTIFSLVGNLLGGFLPNSFSYLIGGSEAKILGYRLTLLISTACGFAALLPLSLIKERKTSQVERPSFSLKGIKSYSVIFKLILTAGLIGFGAGYIIPLFNVFFAAKFMATDEQVGVIFALGQIALTIGTLLAPTISDKLGKVKVVVICQFVSIPFISLIALSPTLELASSAYLARGTLMNMAAPVGSAFAMEIVKPTERATTSGFQIMADNIPRAVGAILGGQIMSIGDYTSPFFFTSAFYLASCILYFVFFRKTERKITQKKIEDLHAPDCEA